MTNTPRTFELIKQIKDLGPLVELCCELEDQVARLTKEIKEI